jgi:hypothetical protein
LLLALLAVAPAASAGELWLASTRALCSAQNSGPSEIAVWKLGPDRCWIRSSIDEFAAPTNASMPLTVFIHGNRADAARSIEMGWQVYNRLTCDAGDQPFRLLIWSWPSDQIHGLRRDAEAKACRSDEEGQFLGMFLNRLPADARVNLFGFSFGSRIATGALELLAGGQVAGRPLADRNPAPRTPMRAMLLAAAEDADWLATGHYHGQALGGVERALVAWNSCDRALRFYPRISCGAEALGYVGPCCSAGECEKLESANVCCEVGRQHDWENYFAAAQVQCRLAWYAFLAQPTAAGGIASNP